MGMMDKFLNAMRLNSEEDENDFYDDDFMDDEEDYAPPRRSFRRERPEKKVVAEEKPEPRYSAPKEQPKPVAKSSASNSNKVTPIRASRRSQGGPTAMEVCVIKPTTVEDAREITETLLANRTVVINVEGLDLEIAQRIIDFTSGSCFAIDGNLQKISNYIFIVTPSNVDISGDFQNIMGAFDASSIQTDI